VEFGLLGPLVVWTGESPVTISAGKQRVLIAALLLRANQVVPVDDLAEAVWDFRPPGSARVTLQNYVKRLRQALGPSGHERIVTRPTGYLIKTEAGELDLARFGQLQAEGRAAARAGDWPTASARLSTALALWRGPPLADVPSQLLRHTEAPRLAEMRLDALEARIDADLHLGRHRESIAELQPLAAAEPLRERLHELLMLALYRSGQQAAALSTYRRARRRLIEEVGIEPGPGLRDLNQRILRSDRRLLPAQSGSVALGQVQAPAGPGPQPGAAGRGNGPETTAGRPGLLPAAVPDFTGRARELQDLSAMVDRAGQTAQPVVITAIGGTAGVGKTALAVHWARQEAAKFPDGQLYVNLRGFGPSGHPVAPVEALRGFLDALQVPSGEIPASLEGRQALYRSLLADKRALILLDNARDADQVRPLLPATPTALVLVTSRNELAGLVAADGAQPLCLDVLTDAEARTLIAGRIGAARLAAEPAATGELIGLCARLPLALAITAARASARPRFPLSSLAAELRDARSRLDALSTGEAATDVRAVFSWSYQNLDAPAARMFRLLSVHPGPDISAAAAASLAGVALPQARTLLRDLARGHLLAEPAPSRYAFHDLLRAYAAEQAEAADSEADARAALRRALDHYLTTAHDAAVLLNPARGPLALPPLQPGAAPEALDGHGQALAWFTAEHQVLLAVVRQAARAGFDGHAWQLPWTLSDYLEWEGRWDELAVLQDGALAAAERLGDIGAQASVHRSIGRACFGLRCWDSACDHLSRALQIYQGLGDGVGQARVHINLGKTLDRMGRYREALGHAQQAMDLFEAAGNLPGQARALNNVGWYHALLGDHQQALVRSRQALGLQRGLGDRCGEANTWDTLGYSHHQLGHLAKAVSCYQQAIGMFSDLGARSGAAEALIHLGDMHRATGRTQAAITIWQQALEILDDLHHPDADQVRAKLDRAATPAATGL
jgi:DNA-binding SARP family transcriptional activator